MKKLLTFAALLVMGTAIIGCRASAGVDVDDSSSISMPR